MLFSTVTLDSTPTTPHPLWWQSSARPLLQVCAFRAQEIQPSLLPRGKVLVWVTALHFCLVSKVPCLFSTTFPCYFFSSTYWCQSLAILVLFPLQRPRDGKTKLLYLIQIVNGRIRSVPHIISSFNILSTQCFHNFKFSTNNLGKITYSIPFHITCKEITTSISS